MVGRQANLHAEKLFFPLLVAGGAFSYQLQALPHTPKAYCLSLCQNLCSQKGIRWACSSPNSCCWCACAHVWLGYPAPQAPAPSQCPQLSAQPVEVRVTFPAWVEGFRASNSISPMTNMAKGNAAGVHPRPSTHSLKLFLSWPLCGPVGDSFQRQPAVYRLGKLK